MLRVTAPFLLALLVSGPALAQTTGEVPTRRVLALYADTRHTYAVQQGDDALMSTLRAHARMRVEYFSEFMEAARFEGAAYHATLSTFLREKYREAPPDLLIAAGRPALEFLLDHRASLFPGVPIVFEALTEAEVPWDRLDARVVGLTGSGDLTGALELALRLQPGTRHVAVINGVSERERRHVDTVRQAEPGLSDRLTFQWLTNHTLAELKAIVAALPSDTVVLFASLQEDATGQFRVARDALEELAPLSTAPIYGPFESYIGYGIVGGTMETWQATGEEAGRLALRILGGESPEAAVEGRRLPVTTIVDWRQVQRWGLDEKKLPPNTVIRFREPTLWEAYRTQVLTVLGVGLAQLLLIAALAVALQRRRVAEATRLDAEGRAAELRHELAHATRVTLLGELAATLAHEINQPLAAILSNAQATKRWLKGDHPNLDEIGATVDDIIADDKRAGEIIHGMRALLRKGDQTRTRFDLATAIRNVAALLHGELIASNVTLNLDLPADPLPVDGDEVATQQVLLNLMMNGIQSIQETRGRIRQLQVQATRVDGTARVTVHDTGQGVSEETRAKLFEPFFTTKSRGLGLGLAICRRIAEAHGGSLALGDSPAGGATFVLALPSAPATS